MSDRADRLTVVLDTDVLVGALTRNVLLSLAEAGLFRPRWSRTTIDEEFGRAFARMYPGQEEVAARQRDAVARAFPEARTDVDAALVEGLDPPDPDDRHVLAAAIRTKAALIVTNNVADFPVARLKAHEIEAVSADDFIADLIDLGGPEAVAALRLMRQRLRRPGMDPEALIRRFEQVGLGQTATLLGRYRPLL